MGRTRYYLRHRESILAKAREKRARDTESAREYDNAYYHNVRKKKVDMTSSIG